MIKIRLKQPSHNGYEKILIVYIREVYQSKICNDITGIDKIIKKKNGKPINYSLRFHLYPGIGAVKTMSGNSVLIQLSKNKSLI